MNTWWRGGSEEVVGELPSKAVEIGKQSEFRNARELQKLPTAFVRGYGYPDLTNNLRLDLVERPRKVIM